LAAAGRIQASNLRSAGIHRFHNGYGMCESAAFGNHADFKQDLNRPFENFAKPDICRTRAGGRPVQSSALLVSHK
jgi:hypothetical protein